MIHHSQRAVNTPLTQDAAIYEADIVGTVRTGTPAAGGVPLMAPLDLSSFHQFRQRLHRGGQWGNYWTPDKSYTDYKTGETKTSKRTHWFPTDQTPPIPSGWAGNIYFGVHPNRQRNEDWQRSRNDTVDVINCVFAEVDGKDLVLPAEAGIDAALLAVTAEDLARVAREQAAGNNAKQNPAATLRKMAYAAAKLTIFNQDRDRYNELARHHVMSLSPQPSAIVFSGGGWHLYWLLADTFKINTDADRKRAKEFQAGWVKFVGGDPGAKDLARVLRVPGTPNRKKAYAPNYPLVEFTHLDYGIEYTISELEQCLPAIVEPERKQPVRRDFMLAQAAQDCGTVPNLGTATTYTATPTNNIVAAYNAAHSVTEMLDRYGYPRHGDRRMRPGGTDSPSVVIDLAKNKVTTFSSNDPLFHEDYHPRSPFDIFCTWAHDGDYVAALEAAAAELGMHTPKQARAIIAAAKEYILTHDIGDHVPAELKAQRKQADGSTRPEYRTRPTDTLILARILDICHTAGRVVGVNVNAYQVVRATDSHGQMVEIASYKTVATVLARHTWLFDVTPVVDKPNTWALTLKVDVIRFPPSYKHTEDARWKSNHDNFDHWKHDDQYGKGTSSVVRSALRAEALAEREPGDDDFAVVDRYRAKLAELHPGLQVMGIPIIDCMLQHPGVGSTASELAAEFGLTISSVNGVLRKLRVMGLVESMRQYKAPSLHFIYDNAFQQIDERAHEFRTYNGGVNRLAKSLEKAQAHTETRIAINQATGQDTAPLESRHQRIVQQRRRALAVLHPEWTDRDLHSWIFADRPTATPVLDRREQQRAADVRVAEGDQTRKAMMQTVIDFRTAGISKADAARYAQMADYTEQEARTIAAWM